MTDALKKWNRRWRERLEDDLVADDWLCRHSDALPTGQALDLACGRGRNALYLARRGFSVTAVDFSEEALSQLMSVAATEKLSLETLCCDLENQPLVLQQKYDLVICFFYLHRPFLPQIRKLVKPGGVAMLRTFSHAGSFPKGKLDERFVLQPGELLKIFSDWQVLCHEEGLDASRKGGSLAGILARKPF